MGLEAEVAETLGEGCVQELMGSRTDEESNEEGLAPEELSSHGASDRRDDGACDNASNHVRARSLLVIHDWKRTRSTQSVDGGKAVASSARAVPVMVPLQP